MNDITRVALRLVSVAALGASLSFSACGERADAPAPGDEPGLAAGAGQNSKILDIWKQLGSYEKVYLKSWKGAFADPAPSPRDVLDAFNEVGFAITGPGGFWRTKVPNQWFGCEADPNTAVCTTLKKASAKELKEWDAFQAEISALPAGKEKIFLARNHDKIKAYLDRYVPSAPSLSEMKDTGFYRDELAESLEAGGSAGGGGVDL